jgi:hypothetical protein
VKNLPKSYHELREYAIAYYRQQAGYIAPNMPVDEDYSDIVLYPPLNVCRASICPEIRGKKPRMDMLGVHADICYNCCCEMHKLFPAIWFNSTDVEICILCHNEVSYDIPF